MVPTRGALRLAAAIALGVLVAAPAPGWAQAGASGGDTATLPETIPLFPLPDVALFPSVEQPFYIFEPRYRELVADALAGDSLIGMVTLRPGYEADYEGRPPIYAIGCVGTITQVERMADGTYQIMLRGVVKFRILGEDDTRLYRLAQVEAIPEVVGDADRPLLREQRDRLVEMLDVEPPSSLSDEEVVNTLAQYSTLGPEDRQLLLEQEGVLARSRTLIRLLGAGPRPRGRGALTPVAQPVRTGR